MIQQRLTHIKGQLLEMMFEQYRDMNSFDGVVDYDAFYQDFLSPLNEIRAINSLDALEVFCESWGMNDMDNEMSFPNLVKQSYGVQELG